MPHSVLDRIQKIQNPTATALLSLIVRKTIGFGRSHIDLTYTTLAAELDVDTRTISRAAHLLESWGDLIRERLRNRTYRWKVPLKQTEILEDPDQTLTVKESPESVEVMIDRSGPCGSIDHDHEDRSIMTSEPPSIVAKAHDIKAECVSVVAQNEPLKKVFKEIDLKKTHHGPGPADGELGSAPKSPLVANSTDDESSHKCLIKSLINLGVSQRKARKLCSNNDHAVIRQVVKTAPNRPQIKNLPAYIVTEIEDGGYQPAGEQTKKIPGEYSHPRNYAHLTNNKVNDQRHKNVKTASDAPKSYPSVDQTREEQRQLDDERRQKSTSYESSLRTLLNRYKQLPDDQKNGLHNAAQRYLESMLPNVSSREQMAIDPTFKRVAIKSVLERFFQLIDDGVNALQALNSPLMLCAH